MGGGTVETVAIVGAGIGGIYLSVELGIAGALSCRFATSTKRGFAKSMRAAAWKSRVLYRP